MSLGRRNQSPLSTPSPSSGNQDSQEPALPKKSVSLNIANRHLSQLNTKTRGLQSPRKLQSQRLTRQSSSKLSSEILSQNSKETETETQLQCVTESQKSSKLESKIHSDHQLRKSLIAQSKASCDQLLHTSVEKESNPIESKAVKETQAREKSKLFYIAYSIDLQKYFFCMIIFFSYSIY